jgi:hypothetical protein
MEGLSPSSQSELLARLAPVFTLGALRLTPSTRGVTHRAADEARNLVAADNQPTTLFPVRHVYGVLSQRETCNVKSPCTSKLFLFTETLRGVWIIPIPQIRIRVQLICPDFGVYLAAL